MLPEVYVHDHSVMATGVYTNLLCNVCNSISSLFFATVGKQIFGCPSFYIGFYSQMAAFCTSSFWVAQKLEK
jgi:hypothetical protein